MLQLPFSLNQACKCVCKSPNVLYEIHCWSENSRVHDGLRGMYLAKQKKRGFPCWHRSKQIPSLLAWSFFSLKNNFSTLDADGAQTTYLKALVDFLDKFRYANMAITLSRSSAVGTWQDDTSSTAYEIYTCVCSLFQPQALIIRVFRTRAKLSHIKRLAWSSCSSHFDAPIPRVQSNSNASN